MLASTENPVPPCQPDVAELPPDAPAPAAHDQPQRAPRPSKAALMPEIARLSLEGHSDRAIARKLGIARRTVDRWLLKQRQQWAKNAAPNAAELFAVGMARLEAVYREAMEAWRRSLADREVTTEPVGWRRADKCVRVRLGEGPQWEGDQEGDIRDSRGCAGDEPQPERDPEARPFFRPLLSVGPGDSPEAMGTLRRATQSGKAALLGKAIQAAKEISVFNGKHLDAVRQAQAGHRRRTRRALADQLQELPQAAFCELQGLVRQVGNGGDRRNTRDLAAVGAGWKRAAFSGW